jgi:chemosensory pili system protein ChpE
VFILFLSAFGIGLAFCAPPGAVTAEAIRRGLAGGFRPAFLLELGSLVGDATWAGIALVGAAVLVQSGPIRVGLGIIGTALLLRIGILSLRDAWRGTETKATEALPGGAFAVGAALSLSNPLSVAFWVGVGGGAVQALVPNPNPSDFVIFYAGFMLACVCWCFFFSALVAFGRFILRPSFFRAVNGVCGLVLVAFGIQLASGVLGSA